MCRCALCPVVALTASSRRDLESLLIKAKQPYLCSPRRLVVTRRRTCALQAVRRHRSGTSRAA